MSMSLTDIVATLENDLSLRHHSESDKIAATTFKHHRPVHAIPFAQKPITQVLRGTKADPKENQPLTTTANGDIDTSGPDFPIASFINANQQTVITNLRLRELSDSAKIYVNKTQISAQRYIEILQNISPSTPTEVFAVCHAQMIDLLVKSSLIEGKARITARENETMNVGDPAIILLSAAELKNIHTIETDKEKRKEIITAFYRNLFAATLQEHCDYLFMPETHNEALHILMGLALEYPTLSIICNAEKLKDQYEFAAAHTAAGQPQNIGRTTKNILFCAHKLTVEKKKCAVYNPSSNTSLYGLTDIGAHWQEVHSDFATAQPGSESWMGIITTAVLGSMGINKKAFAKIVERNLNNTPATQPPSPIKRHSNAQVVHSARANQSEIASEQQSENSTTQPVLQKQLTRSTSSGSRLSFHSLASVNSEQEIDTKGSQFNDEQLQKIINAMDCLTKEINSCWPYPNKDRKAIKVQALRELIDHSKNEDISAAINAIKVKYPDATAGNLSTRTADLLDELEGKEKEHHCCF